MIARTLDTLSYDLKLPFAYEVEGFCALGTIIVVACHLPNNAATPYATWRSDLDGNCFWGHYFKTEEECRADFADRLGFAV